MKSKKMELGDRNQKIKWKIETERDLLKYARYGHGINSINERLAELSSGRRTVALYEKMEGGRGGERWVQEEIIVAKILELEERRDRYTRFRENIDAIIDFAFKDLEHKTFIKIYWWSNLPKSRARDLIMDEIFLSRRTFYRWREDILQKLAQFMGYLDPDDEYLNQKTAPITLNNRLK